MESKILSLLSPNPERPCAARVLQVTVPKSTVTCTVTTVTKIIQHGEEVNAMRIADITEDTVFCPVDFDSDRYIGRKVFNRKGKPPAVILMSRRSDHPHYVVVDGLFRHMVFPSYRDALDYCRERGYEAPDR